MATMCEKHIKDTVVTIFLLHANVARNSSALTDYTYWCQLLVHCVKR